jgi:hypothetical protein
MVSSNSPQEVWVVKGIVTDPSVYSYYVDIHPDITELPLKGDPEWRFFDSDPSYGDNESQGCLSSSDFLTLEHGLAAHDGYIIHYVAASPPDVLLMNRWEKLMNNSGSWATLLDRIADEAYEEGILGTLLDRLEKPR